MTLRSTRDGRGQEVHFTSEVLREDSIWQGAVDEIRAAAHLDLVESIHEDLYGNASLDRGDLSSADEAFTIAARCLNSWESGVAIRYVDGVWEPEMAETSYVIGGKRFPLAGSAPEPEQLERAGHVAREIALELSRRRWNDIASGFASWERVGDVVLVSFSKEVAEILGASRERKGG